MDELLRNWLRRYFVDPVGALPLIKEELRSYPPEVARQFHTEKNIIDEYFALVVKDGHCPSEVWLPLHPGLSKAAEAIIKQIESMVLENRKAGRLGRKLGPYRLLYRIGAGGMAEVYAAEKTDVEVKRRALKIIRLAERYQDWPAEARQKLRDDLAKRLLEEVAILEEIHHPRIVRYFDPLTDPASGELCIVTELIEGFSLERLLEEGGSFPPREGLAVATAIGEGLVEVHNKKVIHRDLTPANVLIDRDGNVKIIDFGLAKSVNPSARNFQTGLDGFHWRALRYASPEQLRREEATTKSDVYMLGKLLYVLLLYRPEWEEREEGQAFWPIASREDPVWESLPADFVAFILKATAEDPAARFDDAATMLEELRRLNGNGVPLQDCIRRVRELQDENDPAVNVRIGDWLATQALPPPLPNVPDGIVVEDEKIRNPSRRRVLVASGLAFFALAVVLPLVLLSLPGASRRGNDSKPISFKGECYWRLRARPGVSVPAQGLPLGAPDVDYLKGGDRVVFQAELSEGPEAYFYVLHIDVQGETHLLYPPGWTWTD
ncbi:MAG: serine/threonine protein kinase, partial [Gemmataceae bacterium]